MVWCPWNSTNPQIPVELFTSLFSAFPRLRIGEALALTVEDVDFEHGTVTIKHIKACLKLSSTACGQRLGRSRTLCPK